MGRVENPTYKNIFINPENNSKSKKLDVYMEGTKLCRAIFEEKAKFVENINIYAGKLNQEDFNLLVSTIKQTATDKIINITFSPVEFDELDENLSPEELQEKQNAIYKKYMDGYRESGILKDPENGQIRHFPDKLTINHAIMDIDETKDNLIKKGLHM